MEEPRETEATPEEEKTGTPGGEKTGGPQPGTDTGVPFGEDDTFWEKMRKGVVGGARFAADKTDLYTRVAGRRMSIVTINRKIDRSYTELGEKIYNLLTADAEAFVAGDPAVQELIGRIRTCEEDLTLKEAEIEQIRHEYQEKVSRDREEGGE